jgi:hypothetical protein
MRWKHQPRRCEELNLQFLRRFSKAFTKKVLFLLEVRLVIEHSRHTEKKDGAIDGRSHADVSIFYIATI